MRRGWEILAFLGLSAAVHAAVLTQVDPREGGAEGQGAGGEDRVTLTAAPESLSALADRWQGEPTVTEAVEMPEAPQGFETPPLPTADSVITRLPDPQSLPETPGDSAPVADNTALPQVPVPEFTTALAAPNLPQVAAPETPEVAGATSSTSSPQRVLPSTLAPPPLAVTPNADTTLPAPPGSTELATARSPRPPLRPEGLAPPPRATPASSAPSTPQPSRSAEGSGGGQTQGAAPTPPPAQPALSAGQRNSLMAQWGAQILSRIERARPRVRGQGRVNLSVRVTRSGQLAGVSVTGSSGDPALDQAAVSAVQRAGRFPAAPAGLTDSSYSFAIPIRFR